MDCTLHADTGHNLCHTVYTGEGGESHTTPREPLKRVSHTAPITRSGVYNKGTDNTPHGRTAHDRLVSGNTGGATGRPVSDCPRSVVEATIRRTAPVALTNSIDTVDYTQPSLLCWFSVVYRLRLVYYLN